jgi:hypothetical protein
MRLHLAVGLELLHQHIENAATGQADPRARVIAFAVAHDADRIEKRTFGDALEKSSSTQPPDSDPIHCPSAFTASSEPGARGAEP